MKTKAAVLTALNEPLKFLELEIPPLKRGQVLVQIIYSGICHTQLNEIRGTKGPDAYLPHTLGHEGSGVVLEIGEGVTKVRPGDHVVLSWIKGSGIDVPNTVYSSAIGPVNSGAISTFLEKAVIAENRLIPIPRDLSLREAALLGCAVPTGAGVVFNDMHLKEGQSIAIFGVGGLGLSAILAARHLKAHPIVAIDVHDHKLEHALELGATNAIHFLQESFLQKLLHANGGKGFDFAFECAGKRKVMETAFECLKAPGGLCVIAGNLPKGEKIEIDPFELIKGKRIVGTWGGGSRIDEDVLRFGEIFIREKSPISSLISHEESLDRINELIAAIHRGEVARGLICLKKTGT